MGDINKVVHGKGCRYVTEYNSESGVMYTYKVFCICGRAKQLEYHLVDCKMEWYNGRLQVICRCTRHRAQAKRL